jgi:hypothetical protein
MGAGWHTFLDRLNARVQGGDPGSIEAAYAALAPTYEDLVAQPQTSVIR